MGGTDKVEAMNTSTVHTPAASLSQDILEVINAHIEDLEQLLGTILVSDSVREEQSKPDSHSALLTELNGIESRLLRLKSRIDL